MNVVRLGRAGVKVSRLALGTVNLGRLLTPAESMRLLDQALDQGINFIDTANEYAAGLSERIIGDWLQKNPGKRDKIVLASKVYERTGPGANDRGLSAYHIKRACEATLRRLQTDHIDLYQMHHIDRTTPWPEIWQAMSQLIQEGKVTYVGSSNFAAWHIAQAQAAADRRGLLGIVAEQSVYNLTNRAVELEVLPACQAMGVAFLAYSPLQDGLLAGGLTKTEQVAAYHSAENDEKFIGLLEKIGLLRRPSETHPLSQFYNEHVYPRLQERLRGLANEAFEQTLPEKRRPDFVRDIFLQLVQQFGQSLTSDDQTFFVQYGTSRDQGTLSRSTFWRTMLKLARLREQLVRYEALCRAYNLQPAELALAWLNKQPGVTAIVIGPRTGEQLKSSIAALVQALDEEVSAALDEIFPGYGAAPEAYAW